jgi:anti-anti-sigma factor
MLEYAYFGGAFLREFMDRLDVEFEEVEGKLLVRLEGRLSAVTAPRLEVRLASLLGEKGPHMRVDLSLLEYMSSAGLRVCLAFSKRCLSLGGEMVFFSLSDSVKEVVQMAGFDKILLLCPNEQEALRFQKRKPSRQ